MDMRHAKIDQVRHACHETLALMDRLERFKPQIEAALECGIKTHTFDHICELVVNQELVPRFYGDDAFTLVMVSKWPLAHHYHIFLAGGNLDTLIEAIPLIEQDALSANCSRVTINGRPGWAKKLNKIGARHAYTMLAIEVPINGQG